MTNECREHLMNASQTLWKHNSINAKSMYRSKASVKHKGNCREDNLESKMKQCNTATDTTSQ